MAAVSLFNQVLDIRDRAIEKVMNKYFNTHTEIDGYNFASKKEASRYMELKLLLKAGYIKDLIIQPKFLLLERFVDNTGKNWQPVYYIADFQYLELKTIVGRKIYINIIEDVKGMKTEVYKLKKKLFLSQYTQYTFRET